MCTCYIYRASLSLLGSPQPMGMSVKGQHTFEILKIEEKTPQWMGFYIVHGKVTLVICRGSLMIRMNLFTTLSYYT